MDWGVAIDWSAATTAVGTAALAVLTGCYVVLTLRLLRTQTDPCVVVFATLDRDAPTILQVVIRNVGRSTATDVRFRSSRPIPARAFGVDPASASPVQPMTSGPLVHGIPALAPAEERRIDWGQYGDSSVRSATTSSA